MAVPSPSKPQQRAEALAQRRAYARSMAPELRTELQEKIARIVLPHLVTARIVAGYHPMKDEISPYPSLDKLLPGQDAVLPWFLDRDVRMIFRRAVSAAARISSLEGDGTAMAVCWNIL